MSKFYEFSQNNSGGSFDFDEAAGITHHVVIEADDLPRAVYRAERIGLYFDGVDLGRDCECCGDRWSKPWSDDGAAEPMFYGKPVSEATSFSAWMPEGKEIAVHYADGRIEWYGVQKRRFA